MSLVPDFVIAFIDYAAFLVFMLATYFALKNYRETYSISVTWLVFFLAMSSAVAFTALNVFEWLGLYPALMDEAQLPIFGVTAASLTIVSIIAYVEVIKTG